MASVRALLALSTRCAVASSSQSAARRWVSLTSSATCRSAWSHPDRRSTQFVARSLATGAEKSTTDTGVERHEFQAETRQLLDIVAKSLYSEKEVFIREVVSNASDALEKLRHLRLMQTGDEDSSDGELRIDITLDKEKKTFTIKDNGLGMEKAELIGNLGTIARSGSQAFLKQLREKGEGSAAAAQSIIGQFGVGFYSTFMVGDLITVYSRSWKPGSTGYRWLSDGSGTFELAEDSTAEVGTKIIVQLKPDDDKFSVEDTVKGIIGKYSNFISFPIYLNGTQINKLQPLWMTQGKKITDDEHKEFYQFLSQRTDSPRYSLHMNVDAPLMIRSLIYIPESPGAMFGIQHEGLALYNRRVLIQDKAREVLPEWLRFVKGVVDCEDIPLNLSREMLQNNTIIRKVRSTLTTRVVKFLQQQVKKDADGYDKFFKECGSFIREGILANDPGETKEEIAKLLRFESSDKRGSVLTSIPEYVERMQKEQNHIFYLCTASREIAESSPYYIQLKDKGFEVLLSYDPADDLVFNGLDSFKGKKVRSAESYSSTGDEIVDEFADLDETKKDEKKESQEESADVKDTDAAGRKIRLSSKETTELCNYFKTVLGKRVDAVKATGKMADFPAIVTSAHISTFRSMQRNFLAAEQFKNIPLEELLRPTLEINPSHPVMLKLYRAYEHDRSLAKVALEQVYDNALITAGVVSDPRHMLTRLNTLVSRVLDAAGSTAKDNEKSEGEVVAENVDPEVEAKP